MMAFGPVGPVSAAAVARVAPKVAIVVGPAGAATDYYRRLANEAAAAALKYTPNVVRVYSPDATWPAVKKALNGASIVVYLGHGNGWPSKYRDSLTPSTQNGHRAQPERRAPATRINTSARRGSRTRSTLAKNAVVVLSHLCYASGNTEPGLPEGTLEVGQQRVDNYAAGFIKAGAAAVIAEGHMGPAYYVAIDPRGEGLDRPDLARLAEPATATCSASTASAAPATPPRWTRIGRARGSTDRSSCETAWLAANTLAGAVRLPNGPDLPPVEPSLAGLGMDFDAPDLASPPIAGAKTSFTFKVAGSDPIRPAEGSDGQRPVGPAGRSPDERPGGARHRRARLRARDPSSAPPHRPPPDPVDLVTPEVLGAVVSPVAATRTDAGISVPVRVPAKPGLYRLVGTIHGSDGVAYDAATQALMPALIVRVTGAVAVRYDAPATAFTTAGGTFKLRVGVTNLGAAAWGTAGINASHRRARRSSLPPGRTLVARWVNLSGQPGEPPRQNASPCCPPPSRRALGNGRVSR